MAVIREEIEIRGRHFMKNYSDQEGYGVERDGVIYQEAIDPIEYAEERVYTEAKLPDEDHPEEEPSVEG